LTVVPSRQRSSGAGIEPLTAIAGRVRPVKFIGVSPMTKSNSVPDSTLGLPGPLMAQLLLGHSPRPAMAPPAARPCTKRRRDGLCWPSAGKSDDIVNSVGSVGSWPAACGPCAMRNRCSKAADGNGRYVALCSAEGRLTDWRSDQVWQGGSRVPKRQRTQAPRVLDLHRSEGRHRHGDRGRVHADGTAGTGIGTTAIGRCRVGWGCHAIGFHRGGMAFMAWS